MADINIQTILASDNFEMMVEKINHGFSQLAELNGGPKGPLGNQGLPGLPGLQGIKGNKGTDGKSGTRLIFINSTPFDSNAYADNTIPIIPNEDDLLELIENGMYNVGDIFFSNSSPGGGHSSVYAFYKIQQIGINEYTYAKFSITDNEVLIGNNWVIQKNTMTVKTSSLFLDSDNLLTKESFSNQLSNTDFDIRSQFLFNTYISSIADTHNPNFTEHDILGESAGNSILYWSKRHFKLGIEQKTPFVHNNINSSDFTYLVSDVEGTISQDFHVNQYLNLWDSTIGGDKINLSGAPISAVKNEFNLLKRTAPILYLQADETYTAYNSDGTPRLPETEREDEYYTNFGIFIKRINGHAVADGVSLNTNVFKNNNEYKSILLIASDNEYNNDVYFQLKNVWSEGNFISEINKQNKENNECFYTTFISHGKSSGSYDVNNNTSVYFGTSNYGSDNPTLTYQRSFNFDTGLEIKTLCNGTSINGTINQWQTVSNKKYLISRIDEDGKFLYHRRDISTNIGIDSQNISHRSRFTIQDESPSTTDFSILKLVGGTGNGTVTYEFRNNVRIDGIDYDTMLHIIDNGTKTFGLEYTRNDNLKQLHLSNFIVGDKYRNELMSVANGNFHIGSTYNTDGNLVFTMRNTTGNKFFNAAGIKTEIVSNSPNTFFWVVKPTTGNTTIDPINVNRPVGSSNAVALYVQGQSAGSSSIAGVSPAAGISPAIQIVDGNEGQHKVLTSIDDTGAGIWDYIYGTNKPYLVWTFQNYRFVGSKTPIEENKNNPFFKDKYPVGTFTPAMNAGSYNRWAIPDDATLLYLNGNMRNLPFWGGNHEQQNVVIDLPYSSKAGTEIEIVINIFNTYGGDNCPIISCNGYQSSSHGYLIFTVEDFEWAKVISGIDSTGDRNSNLYNLYYKVKNIGSPTVGTDDWTNITYHWTLIERRIECVADKHVIMPCSFGTLKSSDYSLS